MQYRRALQSRSGKGSADDGVAPPFTLAGSHNDSGFSAFGPREWLWQQRRATLTESRSSVSNACAYSHPLAQRLAITDSVGAEFRQRAFSSRSTARPARVVQRMSSVGRIE
jgi:hypothetical protein